MPKKRKSPRPHKVNTKHPRYTRPVYSRGKGGLHKLNPLRPDDVVLPLDDSVKACESLDELEREWDKATPYEKQMILQTIKQGAIQSNRLLEGRTIDDPARQMEVYKTQTAYSNAYQAFNARLQSET